MRSSTVFALLCTFVASALSAVAAGPVNGIDLETANRMVSQYARHVVSRLPRDWREAEEKKWESDPPRIDAQGIFQLAGPDGRIAFEYDDEGRRLLCWAVIHKMRREVPLIGLTREEILDALERAAASGVDTGGGDVAYDPVSDGFFLLRVYDQPPKKAGELMRALDRLTAAGEDWSRSHYLDAVLSHAATMRPPSTATARDGELAVTLVLTPDVRYHELWHRPPGAVQPQLVTRTEYTSGQEVWAMALFSGATAKEDGSLRLEAQYSFVYPNGEEKGSRPFVFWEGAPPPRDHLQIVENRAAIEIDDEMPVGEYVARIKVCDVSTERCLTAESPFRVLPRAEP